MLALPFISPEIPINDLSSHALAESASSPSCHRRMDNRAGSLTGRRARAECSRGQSIYPGENVDDTGGPPGPVFGLPDTRPDGPKTVCHTPGGQNGSRPRSGKRPGIENDIGH